MSDILTSDVIFQPLMDDPGLTLLLINLLLPPNLH